MSLNPILKTIEEIRKKKGISKTHIAKHCGKSPQWYSDITSGRRRMYVDDLIQVTEAIGKSIKLSDSHKTL